MSLLPDSRQLSLFDREVEDGDEVGDCSAAEMFVMQHRETIRPDG